MTFEVHYKSRDGEIKTEIFTGKGCHRRVKSFVRTLDDRFLKMKRVKKAGGRANGNGQAKTRRKSSSPQAARPQASTSRR